MMQLHKTKIIRIISRLCIGGASINSILLTSGLDKNRFDSILVTGIIGENEGDMSYLAEQYGVNPIIISELGREISWKSDLVALWKLIRLIKKEKPDIIDTQTAKAGTLGRIAGILTGVPCKVHTFHGHVFHSYFGTVKTKIFIWIERILARFTDRIIVVSPLQYEELYHQIKIAPENKFSIIRYGFDLDEFFNANKYHRKLRRELNILEDTFLVGIVGRLTAIKNHVMFLKSAKKVLEKIANVKFIVVGGGELESEIKELAVSLEIQDKVIFLGWRRDMPAIYIDMDLVVLSSLNEGTPVTLIEAMASGKAIVSTAVGGVPDIVLDGQTGILVPSGDEERFADAIVALLKDAEKRKQFGEIGCEFVRATYTKERLCADISGLYDELLSNSGR